MKRLAVSLLQCLVGASAQIWNASVSPSLAAGPLPGLPAAPMAFQFAMSPAFVTTGLQTLELRVYFVASATLGDVATLRGAPVGNCHDLLLEVGDDFPSPLGCYSGSFTSQNPGASNRFFGLRFGMTRSPRAGGSYSFVVTGIDFLRSGAAAEFAWRFELRDAGTDALIGPPVVAILGANVRSAAGCPAAQLAEFRAQGGQRLQSGVSQVVWLSFSFVGGSSSIAQYLDTIAFEVTLLPLFSWDLGVSTCQLAPGVPATASCDFQKLVAGQGFNRIRLRPGRGPWPQEALVIGVVLRGPTAPKGFLPVELMASVVLGSSTCGPYLDGPYTTDFRVHALEVYSEISPQVRITSVGSTIENTPNTPVVLAIRLGATMRSLDLRNEARQLKLVITVSSGFFITAAANVDGAPALGTDRTPSLLISADGQSLSFLFTGQHSIAFGNVEYSVQLFVTNPPYFYWAVLKESWTLSIEQGPRQYCEGCPLVTFDTLFSGASVEFAIRQFEVLLNSWLLDTRCDVFFRFQLIDAAIELRLQAPSGYTTIYCAFDGPKGLSPIVASSLVCSPQGSSFQILGLGAAGLPQGYALSFRGLVQSPAVALAATSPGMAWSALALGWDRAVVARSRTEATVRNRLYRAELPSFDVSPNDKHPNVTTAVTVTFSLGHILQPGEFLQLSAPGGFLWKFSSAEFVAKVNTTMALPVKAPFATGTSNVLLLEMINFVQPLQTYAFSAGMAHPADEPDDYHWSLESFGQQADADPTRCYEVSNKVFYLLSLLLDCQVLPWTYVRAVAGPASFRFRTTQPIATGGSLVLRSPAGVTFSTTCAVSTFDVGFEVQVTSATTIPAGAVRCAVVTPSELHLKFGTDDPGGFRGLQGDQTYSTTIHSIASAWSQGFASAQDRWFIETRNAFDETLDVGTKVEGYSVGEPLPYAEILPGAPASGAISIPGAVTWVTLAFRVAVPTRVGQTLSLQAAQGFQFDTLCSVRNPAAFVVANAIPVGRQLARCQGLGERALLEIQAVWSLQQSHTFQIQIRNAVLSIDKPLSIDAPFVSAWRLCIDGCLQMAAGLTQPITPRSLSSLFLWSGSLVYGANTSLVVSFVLETTVPPGGRFALRAPNGYAFSAECAGFNPSTQGAQGLGPGGLTAPPQETNCSVGAVRNELILKVGPMEVSRLLANRAYAFAVGLQNPLQNISLMDFAWTVRTEDASGAFLDVSTSEDAMGVLMLPAEAIYLVPARRFVGALTTMSLSFCPLGSTEQALLVTRIEVSAPIDRDRNLTDDLLAASGDSEWDLSDPSACSGSFVSTRSGLLVNGLQYENITSGNAVCHVDGPRLFSVTFRPSIVSPERVITFEFVARNPIRNLAMLWNLWRVRLLRLRPTVVAEAIAMEINRLALKGDLFVGIAEANFNGFSLLPTFSVATIQSSSNTVNESATLHIQLRPPTAAVLGSFITILAPVVFTIMSPSDTYVELPGLVPLLLTRQTNMSPNEACLFFNASLVVGDTALEFALQVRNPSQPSKSSNFMWEFLLQGSENDGCARSSSASTIARSFLEGYDVYLPVIVAGLFGSVREVGSVFNSVRITFELPVSLARGGILQLVAPVGYTLLSEGFSPESLPTGSYVVIPDVGLPFSTRSVNVSVPYGLEPSHFYAFGIRVENPLEPPSSGEIRFWEFWCLFNGEVVAANLKVPPFALEARFSYADVLPSSVVPSKERNVVEVYLQLASSDLLLLQTPKQQDVTDINVFVPDGFLLSGDNGSACHLDWESFLPSKLWTSPLEPLPFGSICTVVSDNSLKVQLSESLFIGTTYVFAVILANPLRTPEINTWAFSTRRNGVMLHVATDVPNFAISSMSGVEVRYSDLRRGETQLVRVDLIPSLPVRSESVIELSFPRGFRLRCDRNNTTLPPGLMPAASECSVEADVLSIRLPPPIPYAPYMPALVVGSRYYFAVFCDNIGDSGDVNGVDIRLSETWPERQTIALRTGIAPPVLVEGLELFSVKAPQVQPLAGRASIVRFTFRAKSNTVIDGGVRGIFLQAPAGLSFPAGANAPCDAFDSVVLQSDESVLPQGNCFGMGADAVSIQLASPLTIFAPAGKLPPKYVFQLSVTSGFLQPMIDVFLLTLEVGQGAPPKLASSSPGYASQIVGLKPPDMPPLPAYLIVPMPNDSLLAPFSTVKKALSRACDRTWRRWLLCLGLIVASPIG